MATVNVTSWAEFVAAVAVSGDTVVCPVDAVWDLTEAEPITEPLEIACAEIQGNGTTITGATFNISGYSIRNTNSLTVDALHLENIYAECREYWWRASADLNFSKSKASGQFINTSYYNLFVFAGDFAVSFVGFKGTARIGCVWLEKLIKGAGEHTVVKLTRLIGFSSVKPFKVIAGRNHIDMPGVKFFEIFLHTFWH